MLPQAQQRALWPRLAGRLAEADPSAAQAWFASAPPSAIRETAGVAWAAGLPEGPRQKALGSLMEAANNHQRLPQAIEALSALPAEQQQATVSQLVSREMSTHRGDEGDAPAVQLLRQIPVGMRDVARRAVEDHTHATPERRAAALKALPP